MAEHAHTTPTPTVDRTIQRRQLDDAVYGIGIITDIIGKLSTLMIRSSETVCGTSFATCWSRPPRRPGRPRPGWRGCCRAGKGPAFGVM